MRGITGKVRMIPLRKLGEDAEKVSIGDTIEVDNKKGTNDDSSDLGGFK